MTNSANNNEHETMTLLLSLVVVILYGERGLVGHDFDAHNAAHPLLLVLKFNCTRTLIVWEGLVPLPWWEEATFLSDSLLHFIWTEIQCR